MDHVALGAAAEQMMQGTSVSVGGKEARVSRTGAQRLRTVRVVIGGREYQLIEQNPEKPSRWGKMARDKHRVVQVRDVQLAKYVAVVVDGKVREYAQLGKSGQAKE